MLRSPLVRPLTRFAAAASAVVLAACADASGGPVGPVEPAPVIPIGGSPVQALRCEADAAAATVRCGPADEVSTGASLARTLGGQNVNLRLTSSNVQYDSAAGVFSMDVTVQNLLVQKMGTADGDSVAGISVFFYSGPNVSGGSVGSVEVRNPDGHGFFTSGSPQPYFHWPEVLSLNQVSAARRWEFSLPPSAPRFTFIVYVRTELLPVVVFDRSVNGNRDLYRIALDGSDLVRMTTATGDDLNATVGGGTVVFTSFRHGNAELYSMPLTGGAETRLTTTAAAETEPALSSDGARLAYVSNAEWGTAKVWTASPQGTGAARATPATFGLSGAPDFAPAWAPTGNRLALVSTARGSPDLYDFDLGGAPALLVGAADPSEVDPAWSPDGTRIAYVSTVTGGGDLYLFRLSDRQVTRVTTREGADAHPTWLRDGRIVYQAWQTDGSVELRWLDPDNGSRSGVIPIPAGGLRVERPYAVPF